MAVLSLEGYFAFLGVSPSSISSAGCELCGSNAATVLRDTVRVTDTMRVEMQVVCCDRCGFLFQSPRFDQGFYSRYYDLAYRRVLGSSEPSPAFIDDQIMRGEELHARLQPFTPVPGRLLDVGCSAGGLMQAFMRHGWRGLGTDPDSTLIEFGRRVLQVPVKVQRAEDMDLDPRSFDLVVITGSLEHVYDPNLVLSLCRRASAEGAILLVEGRGLGQARQVGSCGHNHRRYLTTTSIELLMRKHGWQPLWLTDEEITGPTRPNSVFGVGVAASPVSGAELEALIAGGKRDTVARQEADFAAWQIA